MPIGMPDASFKTAGAGGGGGGGGVVPPPDPDLLQATNKLIAAKKKIDAAVNFFMPEYLKFIFITLLHSVLCSVFYQMQSQP